MRWVLWVWALVAPCAAWAEAGTLCSEGRHGHAFCIRPAHFAFDLCHTLQGEAARHGLDPGFFTRLIWQESRFDPNALSPANAMGIAQFIASTAKLRGLADPYTPAAALEASARYLAHLTQEFGNPGLAAAAYNAGEDRAGRFLAMQSGLPRETTDYVQIITGLAAEDWRDAPPRSHDFRLDNTRAFLPACLALAHKRRVTPLKPPAPRLKPWGVHIAFGTSRNAALAAVRRNTRTCKSMVSGEKIDFVRDKRRKIYVIARIGHDSRDSATDFCIKLAQSGCRCRVYRTAK